MGLFDVEVPVVEGPRRGISALKRGCPAVVNLSLGVTLE